MLNVAILTVPLRVASTLPAASVERYATVCSPSLEWSAGAATTALSP
jgi:hypothetical protein